MIIADLSALPEQLLWGRLGKVSWPQPRGQERPPMGEGGTTACQNRPPSESVITRWRDREPDRSCWTVWPFSRPLAASGRGGSFAEHVLARCI